MMVLPASKNDDGGCEFDGDDRSNKNNKGDDSGDDDDDNDDSFAISLDGGIDDSLAHNTGTQRTLLLRRQNSIDIMDSTSKKNDIDDDDQDNDDNDVDELDDDCLLKGQTQQQALKSSSVTATTTPTTTSATRDSTTIGGNDDQISMQDSVDYLTMNHSMSDSSSINSGGPSQAFGGSRPLRRRGGRRRQRRRNTSSSSNDNSENDDSIDDNDDINSFDRQTDEHYDDHVDKDASRAVFRFKLLILGILLLATIFVSFVCYWYTSTAEEEEFNLQFAGTSEKVIDAFQSIFADNKISTIASLGIVSSNSPIPTSQQVQTQQQQQRSSTSNNVSSISPWPFVTMSMFQHRASAVRMISGSLYIGIIPVVQDDNKLEWEQYSTIAGPIWRQEGFVYQKQNGLNKFEISNNYNYMDVDMESNVGTNDTNNARRREMKQTNNNTSYDDESTITSTTTTTTSTTTTIQTSVQPIFFYNEEDGVYFLDFGPGPYFPRWQSSPVLYNEQINENLIRSNNKIGVTNVTKSTSTGSFSKLLRQCYTNERHILLSGMESAPPGSIDDTNPTTALYATLTSFANKNETYYDGDPFTRIFIPIVENVGSSSMGTNNDDDDIANKTSTSTRNATTLYNVTSSNSSTTAVVAVIVALLDWNQYFANILPRTVRGIHIVLHHTCTNQTSTNSAPVVTSYTYEIDGNRIILLGIGDNHDHVFSSNKQSSTILGVHTMSTGTIELILNQTECYYGIDVYPSQVFYDTYMTATPLAITFSVAFVFVFTTIMFLVYDRLVERRQRMVLTKAAQSAALISSLFPKAVQERLIQQKKNDKYYRRNNKIQNLKKKNRIVDDLGCGSSHSNAYSLNQSRHKSNDGTRPKFMTQVSNLGTVFIGTGGAGTGVDGEIELVPVPKNNNASRQLLTSASNHSATKGSRPALMRHASAILLGAVGSGSELSRQSSCRTLTSSHGGSRGGGGGIGRGGMNRQYGSSLSGEIADLYPHCTVFFGDIAGFTAWSSSREPAQVFTLLQAVYQRFDAIARRRKVFKVETVGDSYVAVTGLPDPQKDHAQIMVKFACVCMTKFNKLIRELEIVLGPGTSDLSMRFGMNSGPVTGGVLRGEKSRFQLFGDTVNTASRMESTGLPNKIQVSKTTANLLIAAGKQHWIVERSDMVKVKGKGILQTYWIIPRNNDAYHSTAVESSVGFVGTDSIDLTNQFRHEDENDDSNNYNNSNNSNNASNYGRGNDTNLEDMIRQDRLINWMVELLLHHIKILVVKRNAAGIRNSPSSEATTKAINLVYSPEPGSSCLDEVKEALPLEGYSSISRGEIENEFHSLRVDDHIISELRDLVQTLSLLYRKNPFHNFEHACHVSMSVNKLLKGIAATEQIVDGNEDMQDYISVINSDPLALLAIVFSALIHDIDHRGVSNAQLIKEEAMMSTMYKNTSIAEQNSLDLSWSVLMSDQFTALRQYIFVDKEELLRFRQIVVNTVLATDIFDKTLNDLRKARWYNAFSEYTGAIGLGRPNSTNNTLHGLKATIVIEHIIQASDVSHTMQHWHVFCKWNKRLFTEMYTAYCEGRFGTDPSTFWYEGEIEFFDNYVVPLAKKLKECQVFGVSSEELLSYAISNREEWKELGPEIVKAMIDEVVPSVREKLGLDS